MKQAKKGRRPDTGTTRGRVLRVRVTDAELADLERVRLERGDATLSDTVRAIPEMHAACNDESPDP